MDCEVTHGVLVLGRGRLDHVLHRAVERRVGQVRRHEGDIQLGAPGVRVGLDSAIGDDQRLAVGHQAKLMRPGAAGRELSEAAVTARDVPDADDAFRVLEIVLGGEQKPTVRRKRAVAVEVPPGRGRQLGLHLAGEAVQNHGVSAGAAREGHGLCAFGVGSGRMAPRGKGHIEQAVTADRDPVQRVGPAGRLGGSQVGGTAHIGPAAHRPEARGGQTSQHAPA